MGGTQPLPNPEAANLVCSNITKHTAIHPISDQHNHMMPKKYPDPFNVLLIDVKITKYSLHPALQPACQCNSDNCGMLGEEL